MSVGMVIFSVFIAVLIVTVIWIIIYLIYNEIRGKPTLPYKKSRFGLTSDPMRSIRDGLIASLMLLFIGGFLWVLYGDTIMNTIDNLQQGKLAGSLSNNTIIGTKNPLDQIIIENLKK
jgi:cellobiose-specific phosphotransferase system component IIC